MSSEDFERLYNHVYDASFWTSCGFENKRSSTDIEREERKYLVKYIRDVFLLIEEKREGASKYMRSEYKKEITALNEDFVLIDK